MATVTVRNTAMAMGNIMAMVMATGMVMSPKRSNKKMLEITKSHEKYTV